MLQASVSEMLADEVDRMPSQLRMAALFMLSHPQDVALLSMRSLARSAGVSHSTLVRLAHWLGWDDYRSIKSAYMNELRSNFDVPAPQEMFRRFQPGSEASSWQLLQLVAKDVDELGKPNSRLEQRAIADAIGRARRTICIAAQPERFLAAHFAQLLDGSDLAFCILDEENPDDCQTVRRACQDDTLVVIDIYAGSRKISNIARHARRHGVSVVGICGGDNGSDIPRIAEHCINVRNVGGPLSQSMTCAMTVVELLASVIVENGNSSAVCQLLAPS